MKLGATPVRLLLLCDVSTDENSLLKLNQSLFQDFIQTLLEKTNNIPAVLMNWKVLRFCHLWLFQCIPASDVSIWSLSVCVWRNMFYDFKDTFCCKGVWLFGHAEFKDLLLVGVQRKPDMHRCSIPGREENMHRGNVSQNILTAYILELIWGGVESLTSAAWVAL